VLVELGVVEQRSKAVYEVLDGATVTDVALRHGVARQTVHEWLRKYANGGIGGQQVRGGGDELNDTWQYGGATLTSASPSLEAEGHEAHSPSRVTVSKSGAADP